MVDYKWVKWKAFQTKFWGIMKKGYFDNLVLRVSYRILCMSFAPLHPTTHEFVKSNFSGNFHL